MRGDLEVLSFLPGEVGLPPYPRWVAGEQILLEIGRTLHSYHESVRSFSPPPDAVWSTELADPAGGPVICHNDVCIENVVFNQERVVGLLDFDFAAPGRPVWDLAMTARYWVPLLDPLSAGASNRGDLDPFMRVRLLADAYGLDGEVRPTFTKVLMQIEEVALRFVLNRVEQGEEGFARMWNELGGYERYERKMAWLRENLDRIDEALISPPPPRAGGGGSPPLGSETEGEW